MLLFTTVTLGSTQLSQGAGNKSEDQLLRNHPINSCILVFNLLLLTGEINITDH